MWQRAKRLGIFIIFVEQNLSLPGTAKPLKDMAKVFKVTPKRIKRSNGLVLTPDMSVIVTTQQHMNSPFSNGAKELKEVYMRIYGFDYQKACCQQADFIFEALG